MLKSLEIKNYVLIHELIMYPAESLNIITGETGTGKSIMLGALGLLLGNRADTKALLDNSRKCVIEAIFDVSQYDLKTVFELLELDFEERTIVRREISPNGKSRAFINDTPVNLDTLKELTHRLMDIHSQHETLQLASNIFQRTLVDAYAQNQDLLKAYRKAYKDYKHAEKLYQDLLEEHKQIEESYDFDNFLLKELEQAALDDYDQQALENELGILENTENIKSNLNIALDYLSKSEFSVESSLKSVIGALKYAGKYSDAYRVLMERVESGLVELMDVSYEIEREETDLFFDKERIAFIQDKLDKLYTLQKKHRADSVEGLKQIREDLRAKIDKAVNFDQGLEKLKSDKADAYEYLLVLAKQLSESRQLAIPLLEKEIGQLLAEIGMPFAKINVQLDEIPPEKYGKDHIGLLFSANKGIPPGELKNVASGGEFSRLMLIVKYVLARRIHLPTMIFDEIDMGVSGQVAIKVGEMLKDIAQSHQLIAITHLPQIAAKAQAHYLVYKEEKTNRTLSYIRRLDSKEQVDIIAEMIGGENPGGFAYESAKELIK